VSAAVERALALLRERGAAAIDHPGGTLLAHLVRTHELLSAWDAPQRVRRAGLCHAAYGTDGFPTPLLALDERARLAAAIGADAEQLVYVYCACARAATYARLAETPLRLSDRFTGDTRALGDRDAADFALLTIANELDVVRAGRVGPAVVAAVRELVRALARYAPDAGRVALAELSPP
jgi:hypothetical protein